MMAAIDPGNETAIKSISIFSLIMNEGRLAVDETTHVEEDSVDTIDLEASEKEIRNLLYGVEHLRKRKNDGDGDEGGDQVEVLETETTEQ